MQRTISLLAPRSSTQLRAASSIFTPNDQFLHRHVGSQGADKQAMLEKVGFNTLDDLVSSTVPSSIRLTKPLKLSPPMSESEALAELKGIMSKNKVLKSFIGAGYYETQTPGVSLRNVCILTDILNLLLLFVVCCLLFVVCCCCYYYCCCCCCLLFVVCCCCCYCD